LVWVNMPRIAEETFVKRPVGLQWLGKQDRKLDAPTFRQLRVSADIGWSHHRIFYFACSYSKIYGRALTGSCGTVLGRRVRLDGGCPSPHY